MTNYDLEEGTLLKIQFALTVLLIGSLLISLTLTYNEILKMNDDKPLYDENEEIEILSFNRVLALIISLLFLMINIKDKNLKIKYNQGNLDDANKQIIAGILSFLASLIVLGTAITGSVENPED